MFQLRSIAFAALALGVLGCAPAPVGQPMTTQETMHTASHWQALAAATAKQISEMRESAAADAALVAEKAGEPFSMPEHLLADEASFYVEPLDPAMPFARAFHELLMTKLVETGANVVLHKGDAYVVHYTVQPVHHDNTDTVNLDPFSEVMITVSLVDGDRLLLRRSKVYYVDDDELFQYLAMVPPPPITQYGSGDQTPLALRQFNVDDGETALAFNQATPETMNLSVQAAPPGDRPANVKAGPFTVYFAFDSAELDDAAAEVVAKIAESQRRTGANVLIAAGHTDRAGSASYNTELSRRRAQAVADALAKDNVPPDEVVVEYFGESRPAVPTHDGERRPENRRVEIYLR